jgi:hypothetical protein
MWHILQTAIIVWLCYMFKAEITPDRSMGHIFLFSVLVAYAVTWLLSKFIDLLSVTFWRSRQFAQWLSNKNGGSPLRVCTHKSAGNVRFWG